MRKSENRCPTCNTALSTPYCPKCGEKPLHARDLTLRGMMGQAVEAIINVDGRLLRSFRCLLTRPGALTVAYIRGQRIPYTLPLQLFLLANVLFFAVQSFTGTMIFSTPLASHLNNDIWGPTAQRLVADRLLVKGTTLELYAPPFDRAVALNAKSLIVLMVPPFVLLLPLLFFRNRRPFVTHVVFSLHLYAFLLVLFCGSLVVAGVDRKLGGSGLDSVNFDHTLSLIEVAVCAVYLYFATGTVYGATGLSRVLKVAPLVVAVAGIVLGYRFVLLVITLYST